MASSKSITVLIAALGGEGGGVLASWLHAAAIAAGHFVQGTSVPGVAQRTGATTYYLEVVPGAGEVRKSSGRGAARGQSILVNHRRNELGKLGGAGERHHRDRVTQAGGLRPAVKCHHERFGGTDEVDQRDLIVAESLAGLRQ